VGKSPKRGKKQGLRRAPYLLKWKGTSKTEGIGEWRRRSLRGRSESGTSGKKERTRVSENYTEMAKSGRGNGSIDALSTTGKRKLFGRDSKNTKRKGGQHHQGYRVPDGV